MQWNLSNHVAVWKDRDWSSAVDLREGTHLVLKNGGDNVLDLRLSAREGDLTELISLPVGDCYVRQSDLITTYTESVPLNFGYQAYFCGRSIDEEWDAIAMELWLSVQTSTLQSYPQLVLRFEKDYWEPAPFGADGLYFNRSRKVGLMIHPLDQPDCDWKESDGGQQLVTFGRFMEKGVIRRMRVRFVATATEVDVSRWGGWMRHFAESPLPLTA